MVVRCTVYRKVTLAEYPLFTPHSDLRIWMMAERGGFEPPVRLLTVQRFSKPPPSATRPSLRRASESNQTSTPGQVSHKANGHASVMGGGSTCRAATSRAP